MNNPSFIRAVDEETQKHFLLIKEDDSVVAKGELVNADENCYAVHENLLFMATPEAILKGEETIYVTVASLKGVMSAHPLPA